MSANKNLKPCPFCGSDGDLIDNRLMFYVSCQGCTATTLGDRVKEEDIDSADWDNIEKTAVDNWNKRQCEDKVDAERYRKLRTQTWDKKGIAIVEQASSIKLGSQCLSHDILDKYLDSI